MMRVTSIIGSGGLTIRSANALECFAPNGAYVQSIRWKRKPIWLPTAKTKVFRVPKRPVIPLEETLEIQRLYNNYRTYMKSLKQYFKEEVEKNAVQLDEAHLRQEEDEDFERCSRINAEWNAKIAESREVRRQKEREEHKLLILEKLEQKKIRDLEIQRMVEENVRKAKEIAPTFITRENIDQAIAEALENITDHNFAITPDGKMYPDCLKTDAENQKMEAKQ